MSTITPDRITERAAIPEQPAPVAPVVVEPPSVPIADPGPLGLGGFALTTFVLCVFNAGLVDAKLEAVVLPIALFYGGIAQLLAGMWEFRKNNTFGAGRLHVVRRVLAVVGGVRQGRGARPAERPGVHGHRAVPARWTIFTAYMTIGALRTNGVIATIFVVLLATFVLLTVGELAQNEAIFKIGGWAGIVTAMLAWYGSAAAVVNSTWGRAVLPVFPIKK